MNMRHKIVRWPFKPTFALRAVLAALAAVLPLPISDIALAQPAPALAEDQRMLPYAKPDRLVDIGGRRIHLHCMGKDSPTVILMAGISSWSVVWYKTQLEIAKSARVCAFDRASYGFSDPAPRPQYLSDTVNDLHTALKAAALPGPYVLVGHSLGGLEARWLAQQWPHDVAGMVLVDTSPAGDLLILMNQPGHKEAFGEDRYVSEKLRCALLAAQGPLERSSPDYERCALGLPADAPAALRDVWPSFFTAQRATAQVSLVSSLLSHHYDSADRLDFGDKPLVVLSADVGWNSSGPIGKFWRSYRPLWFAQHEALSRLSSRGAHRVIEQSGHEMHLDKPQAVIDAVNEVLRQLPG
jgi:pimeloyl-ACP methyl ester carboxylesterase